MIYFRTQKKDTGLDFIDINIPSNKSQLDAYYETRKIIFCEEQGLFKGSDFDSYDTSAIPIVAINHYLGSPDEIVGVVRIYREKEQEWFGGRLGVMKEYRSFSKFICPNLFRGREVSALYHLSVAAGLIYRAVSLAHYLGCTKFSAYIQEQNVKLFQRLHWNIIEEINSYGIKHFLMEADLSAYPPAPIHTTALDKNILINLQKVA
ncbi:MSMEG_0567/Sll0786 family nitrogen starvation N-acetyltransferase [Aquimarina sp. RZ0]|uniref:MSMEG_0567/Sll0786 family nitrogen starvation N-acetyltransferase n=1 Tax=Aquimarina sp. RZ0 TaxID=2607730 RepID=UPI0011F19CC0|nr:MSMEG_0567/Sll0786 family nitrogen starvation N-acetyltransferase [Aquimarina sp. RZ0]KAA1243131.1 GNAT family N-acetyltransferase [Aquimarina sp. RZ0]